MILNNSNNYNIPKSNSKYDKLDAYLKYCDRVQNAYIEKHDEVTKLYNYIRVIQDEDPNVSLNQINISALINYLDNIIKSTDIKEKDLKKKKEEQKKWKKENENIMKKLLKDFDIKKMREANTPTRKNTPNKTNNIKKTKKQKRDELEKYKKYETVSWGGNEDKSIYLKVLSELENNYKLAYVNEVGDGDCLFRALDRTDKGNINIDPTDFKNIRKQIGDFIENNVLKPGSISEEQKKQIIEAIILDGGLKIKNRNKKNNDIDVNHMIEKNLHIKYIRRYIKQIKSTKWGGHPEISIWNILKSKCINVFEIHNDKLLLPDKCSQPIKDCINLFYHNQNHYGSLHYIKSPPPPSSGALPPPPSSGALPPPPSSGAPPPDELGEHILLRVRRYDSNGNYHDKFKLLNLEDSQKYKSGNLTINNSEKIKLNDLTTKKDSVYIKYKLDYNSDPPFNIEEHVVIKNLDGPLEILDYFDLVTFRAGGRKENWGDEIDFKTLSEEEKKRLYIRFIADNHHSLI